MIGNIHSIETFGTVDGPGIRFVIFMQGCDFRCQYCHNPDSWVCGKGEQQSTDELIDEIKKYTRYIQGVTVSGGEPLLQIEFITELFTKVKELGLNTCLDTCGSVFNKDDKSVVEKFDKLLNVCDLVMLDIKHINNEKHIELTGKENTAVLNFAKYLSDKGQPMWIRYVLVPTINDDDKTLLEWKSFVDGLNMVEKIELLPYHRLAIEKYERLGIKYRLENVPEPTQEQINHAKEIFEIRES